jgi:hypothetical protein
MEAESIFLVPFQNGIGAGDLKKLILISIKPQIQPIDWISLVEKGMIEDC